MVSETMALRGTSSAARMMGLLCLADSKLGEFWEGQCPVTRTGNYSDVVVVDADDRIIPWQRMAHLERTEVDRTMREIVDRLHTFLRNMEAAELATLRKHREDETSQWSRPRENPGLKKQLEVITSGIVDSGRKPGANDGRKGADRGVASVLPAVNGCPSSFHNLRMDQFNGGGSGPVRIGATPDALSERLCAVSYTSSLYALGSIGLCPR